VARHDRVISAYPELECRFDPSHVVKSGRQLYLDTGTNAVVRRRTNPWTENVARRLGLNSRLRWLPAAGQAAFLVLNYDWRKDAFSNLQPFVVATTLKFNYTFRY